MVTITIAGPAGSGKSTIADYIATMLDAAGIKGAVDDRCTGDRQTVITLDECAQSVDDEMQARRLRSIAKAQKVEIKTVQTRM